MRCHKNKLNTKMAFRRVAQEFWLTHFMSRGVGSFVGRKSCVRAWPPAGKPRGRSREWASLVASLPLRARAGTVLATHSCQVAAAAMLPSPRRLLRALSRSWVARWLSVSEGTQKWWDTGSTGDPVGGVLWARITPSAMLWAWATASRRLLSHTRCEPVVPGADRTAAWSVCGRAAS